MGWQCLLLAIICQILIKDVTSKEITIQVNPKKLLQYVPERFLSITVDPGTILLAGNLNNGAALNMARGLSPSFVRLGGKSTNYIKFGKELLLDNTTITEEQWDSVNAFARAAGMDLITSVNPTERINGVWDSRDALKLISYSEKQGYTVAWQLGYDIEGISAPGAEVGRDVVRLRKIVDGFSRFTRSPIFAPDFPEIQNSKEAQFVRDLLIQAGPVLGAIFIQPPFKPEEDPGQTIMNTILNMESNIWGKAMRLGRMIPRKPIWIAEREISKGSSEDALVLAKRLGVSARIGIQVLMRQVGPESLTTPTPEYWMALMYKNLVGRGVLDAKINSGQNRTELHIFAHCAQSLPMDRSIIDAGIPYDKGAVTVFGVNEGPQSQKISLRVGMREERVHVYSLTFSDDTNKKTEDTFMNGQMLTLSPEGELPIVSPKIVRWPSRIGIIIPARSVFFFVLPDVKSRVCSSTSAMPHEIQDLSRKLIQVAAEVLDKPIGMIHSTGEDDEEGKIYVRFAKKYTNSKYIENQMKTTTDNVITAKPDELTLSTLSSQQNNMENTTAQVEVNKANETNRKKRSADSDYSNADMEVAATNDDYIPSQEELVKYLNSFSTAIYEKSHKNGKRDTANEEEDYEDLPKEIINTMKKIKLTFKPLGISTEESKDVTDEPNAIQPLVNSNSGNTDIESTTNQGTEVEGISDGEVDSENYDENVNGSSGSKNNADLVLEGETPNNNNELVAGVKRAEKEVIVPESSEEEVSNDLEEKDNFREEAENSITESKGAESFQESDIRSEADSAVESSSPPQDKSKETISSAELSRESESPVEAPSIGAVGTEDSTTISDEQEVVNADESSKDYGSLEGIHPAPYSVPSTDATSPSKITFEDNKDTLDEPEVNEKVVEKDDQKDGFQPITSSSSSSERLKEEKLIIKNVITTTELPDVIAIDGIERDKLDELLLDIADNKLNDKDFIKNVDTVQSNDIQKRRQNDIKTYKLLNTNDVYLAQNKKPSEPETETTLKDGEIEKNEESNDPECIVKEETSDEPEGLKNGPSIPTTNSIDTVKIQRGITSEPSKLLTNNISGKPVLMLLDPSAKLKELKERATDLNDDDDSEKVETDDKAGNEDDPVPETNDDSDDAKDIKQLPVASFKEVPLQTDEDKSYNPTEKTSEVNDNTLVGINESTDLEDKPVSLMEDAPESNSLETSQTDNLESNKENIKEETSKGEEKVDGISKRLKAQKERHEKLMAIRNKILETREKFRALAREDNWRLALQKREEEMRNLLNQERELRKKSHALSHSSADHTLSRTRRLTYYPEDDSKEDYDYETEKLYHRKPDSCNVPLTMDDGKLYLNQDVLSNALKDSNHVIFPLDHKPQAVVLNNRIIPAKLYGVVNIYDGANSKTGSVKSTVEPINESYFQKYYDKSYDAPLPKYSPPIPPISQIKSFESYPIPKDSFVRRIDDSSNFLPVVVISPEINGLRKKRSTSGMSIVPPHSLLDHLSLDEKKPHLDYNDSKRRKRSVPSEKSRSKKSISGMSKETEVVSNEIKQDYYKPYKSNKIYSEFPISNPSPNGYMEMGPMERGPWSAVGQEKGTEERTFAFPPLFHTSGPSPLQMQQNLLPQMPAPIPPPQHGPPLHHTFPPEPLPPIQDFHPLPESFLPLEPKKEDKQPSQAYFFNMLQDKFKSLMGMLETLAVWCGANTNK